MVRERKAKAAGQRVVIIGNGIAGNSAAAAIRQFDRSAEITMVSGEGVPLYSPCAFYKCLSGEMAKEKLFLKASEDYAREGIKAVFGQEASAVNVRDRKVSLGEHSLGFDRLVLATGSQALLIPLKGADQKGVFPLKTMADLESVLAWPAGKVAVIGSGPIGLEAAIALRQSGHEVSVIEILGRILPRLFDDGPASILKGILEDHGVKVFTGEKVTEIGGSGAVESVVTDKRQMPCDMVIMAAGVRPNTGLARQTGLEMGELRGIKTDDNMMTSQEGIYACGDCVESRDMLTGQKTLSLLWHNARRQGWTAGANCAGQRSRFIGSLDATIVDVFGQHAVSIGRSGACFASAGDYDVIEKRANSDYSRLLVQDDKLVGVQLINKIGHAGLLCSKMLRKDSLAGLGEVVLDQEVLAMRPWHHWIKQYIT